MKVLSHFEIKKQPLPKNSYLADEMRHEKIAKCVITLDDVGRGLEWGWGTVLPNDVGKICVMGGDLLFSMENDEQRNKRLEKK